MCSSLLIILLSLKFSDATITRVSLAYIFGVMFSKRSSQSLMHNKNSNGTKHVPCGIPHFKVLLVELAPSK